jgi:hypothetical protein
VTLHRHERRLREAFWPLLFATVAIPIGVACSTGDEHAQLEASFDEEKDAAPPGELADAGVCAPHPTEADIDGGGCVEWKALECGLPSGWKPVTEDCYLPIGQCAQLCNRLLRPCHAYGDSCVDGSIPQGKPVVVECAICPGSAGRRPEAFAAVPAPRGTTPLGAYFAELASLEAASIEAFGRLRDELTAFDAPADLVAEAERARRDEIAHARSMSRLAKRYGAKPSTRPPAPRRAERPFFEVARENMVEGCVRETFGALVAAWQASHAHESMRADLAQIAEDELRHAALAWSVAAWSSARLTDDERAALRAAVAEVTRELARAAQQPVHPDLRDAGVPDAPTQRRMLEQLGATLWAA